MKKESTKVFKVNATIDDDINLIIDTIQKVDSEMVLLVLPEGNDLINSPVGLKTLKRKALTMKKALIVVAPSKQYQLLAEEAGLITTISQDAVDATLWDTALAELEEYKQSQVGLNSARGAVPRKTSEVIPPPTGKKIIEPPNEETVSVESLEEKFAKLPHTPEVIAPKISNGTGDNEESKEENTPEKRFGYEVASVKVGNDTEENDKPVTGPVKQQGVGMIGVDFSKVVVRKNLSLGERFLSLFKKKDSTPKPKRDEDDEKLPQIIKPQQQYVMPKQKGTGGFMRAFGVIVFGIIVLAVGIFTVYYLYMPRLRIEIKVTSDKIELTDKYTATTASTGFDVAKKQFQLLKEKGEQKGSVNITATGDGVDGTKASGTISLTGNTGVAPVTVPSGTVITSPGGLKFILQSAVTVPIANGVASGSVVASDFGEEYNLSPVSGFTVAGATGITGSNSTSFTGGTKRTFKVLSKKDVDDATNQLKNDLFDQLKSDLQFRNQNTGFVYIPESFSAKVEGTPVVNPAIGTETSQAFLEMSTSATAYYYQKESFQKLVEKYTGDTYKKNKSLADDTDLMIEDTTINVTKVTVGKDDKVDFDFKSSALVTPKINTDQLRKDIVGKKWPDMLTKVSSINTLASTPTITFYPEWMPPFLRYVPAEESRVDISVKVTQ